MLLAVHKREWMGCLFVCFGCDAWTTDWELHENLSRNLDDWLIKPAAAGGKKITSARLKCICDVLCCEKWSFINLRVMVLTQELPPSISHFPHPDVLSLFFFIFPIPLTFFHPEYHVYVWGWECVCEYWVFIFHISLHCWTSKHAKANCFVTEMTSNRQVKWGFH